MKCIAATWCVLHSSVASPQKVSKKHSTYYVSETVSLLEFKHVTKKPSFYSNHILQIPTSTDKPVTVTLMLAKKAVTEGGSITVECAANCNPPPHTYTWLKREMGQITKITSTLSRKPFINITRDTFILCIAHNDIGEGQSDWLDLDVQCKYVLYSISSFTPEVTDVISIHPRIQCLTFTQMRCRAG